MLGLRRTNRGGDPDASILPLINILFLLLIFSMLPGRMVAIDPLDVEPPYSATDEQPGEAGVRVLVTVDGRTAIDGEVLPRDAIVDRIMARLVETPELRVRVMADARADSREVTVYLEALRAAGVEDLHLMTVARP